MSYRHTLEAAIDNLHEIEDLVKGFPMDGSIPAIELDLSLQKIRNLYELLLLFRRTEDQAPVTETTVVIEKSTETEVTEVKIVAEPPAPPPPPSTPPPPPVQEPEKHKTTGEAQIISDRFKGRSTLHESFHQTFTKETNTLVQGKPVSNLMTAIGINDRFTFIRELFNNDAPAFEKTMNQLNEASSFNDAYNYMMQQYDWDMDSDAVQLLLEIIRRKHIVGRNE